ncbi:MAG: AraC family transcriptional regulator [Bacteroides sp.]|nr:AraC family transcriptional regulator [Bacteroides sp.]
MISPGAVTPPANTEPESRALSKHSIQPSRSEIISRQIAERAKRRLTESTDDISIVAYELGFQHPQHFSRMFKRITGISPTQFREKVATINNN